MRRESALNCASSAEAQQLEGWASRAASRVQSSLQASGDVQATDGSLAEKTRTDLSEICKN